MGKGKAIAGFVLSIVSLVLGLLSGVFSIVALPVSIVGLVLSIVGGKQCKAAGEPSGLATAGMVIGIIAVVITTITFFSSGICVLAAIGAAA